MWKIDLSIGGRNVDSDIAEYKEIEFQKRHAVFKHLVFIMLSTMQAGDIDWLVQDFFAQERARTRSRSKLWIGTTWGMYAVHTKYFVKEEESFISFFTETTVSE